MRGKIGARVVQQEYTAQRSAIVGNKHTTSWEKQYRRADAKRLIAPFFDVVDNRKDTYETDMTQPIYIAPNVNRRLDVAIISFTFIFAFAVFFCEQRKAEKENDEEGLKEDGGRERGGDEWRNIQVVFRYRPGSNSCVTWSSQVLARRRVACKKNA